MRNFEIVKTKLNLPAIFLTALYLMLSIGIGIKSHYCHGELASVSYALSSPDCACGDESSEMTCCSTIERFYQLDDDVRLNQKEFSSINFNPFLFADNYFVEVESPENVHITVETELRVVPRYILNKALILYA